MDADVESTSVDPQPSTEREAENEDQTPDLKSTDSASQERNIILTHEEEVQILEKSENQEQETFRVQDVTYEANARELDLTPPEKEEEVISASIQEVITQREERLVEEVEIVPSNSEEVNSVELESMESPSARPSALVKFRWAKIVDTTANDVGFYPSYAKDDPILLTWDDSALAYFSPELKVDCGDFQGNIMVDGKVYPVEGFSIRTYTFEVDLFMKDDVLEDEAQTEASKVPETHSDRKPLTSMENSYKDSSVPSLIEEKVGQPLKGFISEEMDMTTLTKNESSIISSVRHSPVGDDAVKTFNENENGDETLRKLWSDRNTPMEGGREKSPSLASNHSGMIENVIEDVVATSPTRSLSHGSVGSGKLPEAESQTLRTSRPPSTGSGSGRRSQQGSVKDEPVDAGVYGRPLSRSSDRFSPARSGGSSTRDIVPQEEPRTAASPAHSLNRVSPPRTPAGSDLSLSRVTPQRDMEIAPVRDRIQENGDVGSGYGLMEGRPPSHPGSRHSSQHSSRAQSLTSITSEQELGQYMGSRSGSVDKMDPSNVGSRLEDFKHDSSYLKDGSRPTSVPNYSTQYQPKSDLRSRTPDNRIRVPVTSDLSSYRESLAAERHERTSQDRASVVSNHSSRASSRTVTPVALEREDLEANITNLRKLLTNRESEVHKLTEQMSDLRDINRSLKEELEHRNKKSSSGPRDEEALELKRLLSEKEIMASEIVTLREEINRLKTGSGRMSVSSGISDYSPNSPGVLQRKITDLEAHIRDLQEVNESARMQLNKAEEKLKYLQDENRTLQSRNLTTSDLRSDGDQHLRVEMRTLEEDIRNLKERNFQLTEENMRLSELQKNRISTNAEVKKLNNSFRSDDGIVRQSGSLSKWEREARSSLGNRGDTRPGFGGHARQSREEFAPKEYRHSSLLNNTYDSDLQQVKDTSSRLLHQREYLKPPHLSLRKDVSSSVMHADSPRANVLHADRSRPDGEVSEKLHSQRYTDSLSYDKRSYDSTRERSMLSHSGKPLSRDYRLHEQNGASTKKHTTDGLVRDPLPSDRSEYRPFSSGAAISSQEIFFNLKQKRENRWVQQDSLADKYISGNLQSNKFTSKSQTYLDSLNVEDTADDSDTATDILLAQESNPRDTTRLRRTSLGSDGSISSLSDVEDNNESYNLRRRSKSVDARRVRDSLGSRQLSTLQRSGSATKPLTSMDSMRGSSGHRSVHPTPLVTQHNKGSLVNTALLFNSSLTQGMRPFAPRGPSDIRTDDVVKFSRLGGKLSQGIVKYVGHLPGRSDVYLGIELDKDEGKHDGTFEDIRYFKCKPSKGVFVAFNKVVMAWAP